MPRPRTATSCDVMPPLAMTQAGWAASAARTTSVTAVDTRREISRLSAASRPRSSSRLVNSSTSERSSVETTCRVASARWASRRAGSAMAATSSSTSVRPPVSPGDRHLPAGQADVRPDDDQPVPAGMAGRPDVRRPQRIPRVQPGQGLHERRPAAVQEGPAGRCRLEQPEDDDIQVGVLHGVHDDEPTAGHAGEELGHPPRPTKADVVKGDAQDVARLDHAAALLGDEVAQVGGGVSEGGVARELGLARPAARRRPPGPSARRRR